jgi:hypothetical protein
LLLIFFFREHTYFRRDDATDLIKKSHRRNNVIGNRWSRLRVTLEKLYATRASSLHPSNSLSLPLSLSLFLGVAFFSRLSGNERANCERSASFYTVQRRPAESLGFHWARRQIIGRG